MILDIKKVLKFVIWSIVIKAILTQVKSLLHFILLFLDLENPNQSSTPVSKLKRFSKSVRGMFYIYLWDWLVFSKADFGIVVCMH